MIWQDLTSEQIAAVDRNLPVVLPLAAIEQHGPHLPLATDRLINEHFCRELEKRMSDGVLILPTVAVTCSRHHMDFPGTLTLSHETLIRLATETFESVIAHGFRNLLIFNSHGGNQGVAQVIVEELGASHPECRVAVATWWRIACEALLDLNESGPGGVGHAGEFETSLVLLAAPKLVDRQAIQFQPAPDTFAWAKGDMLRASRASLYRSMRQMTRNGVFGDPTAASSEKGEAISLIVVDALARIVNDLRDSGE